MLWFLLLYLGVDAYVRQSPANVITCADLLQKLRISFPWSQLVLMEEEVTAVALLVYDSSWYMDPAPLVASVIYRKSDFCQKAGTTEVV